MILRAPGRLSIRVYYRRFATHEAELDRLLAVRLRDAGDVRKLFDALKVDAYYYLLLVLGSFLMTWVL